MPPPEPPDSAADPAAAPPSDDGGELINKNLSATVCVYNTLNEVLKHQKGESVTLTRKEALRVRRAAIVANQTISGIVKAGRAREDRLIVEQHLMRQAARRDSVDRDAHRARVFERLRSYSSHESLQADQPSQSSHGAYSALNTQSETVVDKALRAVSGVETALAALSPTGAQKLHGVGMFAARGLA